MTIANTAVTGGRIADVENRKVQPGDVTRERREGVIPGVVVVTEGRGEGGIRMG